MRTIILATVFTFGFAMALGAQNLSQIDSENLFPSVGAVIVWADPNEFGVPSGVLGVCSGTLIHEQILLTAGHCSRGTAEDPIPPFIHLFVSFSVHVFDNPSTWIRVTGYSWHPGTLPCPNHVCPWPVPPIPHFHDVGLMFLEKPVALRTEHLAQPGSLDQSEVSGRDHIIVGYGFPDSAPNGAPPPWSTWPGVRHYRVIEPERVYDDGMAIGGPGENCFGDSGGPTFLGPLASSGNKRRSIVATTSAFIPPRCSTGSSIVTRIDSEVVQSWIDQEIKDFEARK
jgi:hypothetical protein